MRSQERTKLVAVLVVKRSVVQVVQRVSGDAGRKCVWGGGPTGGSMMGGHSWPAPQARQAQCGMAHKAIVSADLGRGQIRVTGQGHGQGSAGNK